MPKPQKQGGCTESSQRGCFTGITVRPGEFKLALTEQLQQKQTSPQEPERRGGCGARLRAAERTLNTDLISHGALQN